MGISLSIISACTRFSVNVENIRKQVRVIEICDFDSSFSFDDKKGLFEVHFPPNGPNVEE